MTERIVLAYSGGLDTSVAIGWIADATGAEVIAVAVDVGQGGEDLDVIRQRALDCGAVEAYVAEHGVLTNPLLTDGYASVGCAPCTRRVLEGEDARAGRWAGIGKTECGIHQ